MSDYFFWNRKTIDNFSETAVNTAYNQGYVFTRRGKGAMDQTRSLRIDLSKFEQSSENRRILRKIGFSPLLPFPIPFSEYQWYIGKMAKDFYETKFGKGTFSTNKTKELLTDEKKSNFNKVFVYTDQWDHDEWGKTWKNNGIEADGFAICYENNTLIHYSYPFYRLTWLERVFNPNFGMGMMIKAIIWAKEQGKKYIYLGSATRPGDVYKLQFEGLEWFDGEKWQTNIVKLKDILSSKLDNDVQKLIANGNKLR